MNDIVLKIIPSVKEILILSPRSWCNNSVTVIYSWYLPLLGGMSQLGGTSQLRLFSKSIRENQPISKNNQKLV